MVSYADTTCLLMQDTSVSFDVVAGSYFITYKDVIILRN